MHKRYKLILLDRDGVINKKKEIHNYVNYWEEFDFLPKSKEAISTLSTYFKIAIITNQRNIGLGLLSLEGFQKISDNMLKELMKNNGTVHKIYFCPHDRGKCSCRKQSPKMIFDALNDFNVSKEETVLLGDSFSDYEAAKNAGIKFIFIDSVSDEQESTRKRFKEEGVSCLTFPSLFDAANFLIK